MSYIRCLSNPECLYIWGETGGKIGISVGTKDTVYVKERNWHSLLRQFAEGWGEDYRSGTLSLKEESIPNNKSRWLGLSWYLKQSFYILFDWKDRTLKARWEGAKRVHDTLGGPFTDFKWVLRDGNKVICEMWETTIHYIVHGNENKWKKSKRKSK
jgi:hypothetical protein